MDRQKLVCRACFMCDFVCNSLCYMPRTVSSQLCTLIIIITTTTL